MDFTTRRSIRKYEEKAVEKEKVDEILKAALLAPTGKNTRATEFIVVDDKELIEKISLMREHGSEFVKNAPLVIGVMGDGEKTTTLIEDCSIAAFAIQVKAHELGLGSCWVQVNQRTTADGTLSGDYFKNLTGAPANLTVACVVALGYPSEQKPVYTEKDVNMTRVSYNKYGNR